MAGIDFTSDIFDQVAAWQDAFISESSLDRYRRACAWTASEVAKAASKGATSAIDEAFENPTPWMRRAFGYTRALNRRGDAVEASLYTRSDQSIVMKYAMGDNPNVRRPGDVGLASGKIYVPHWKNLQATQGISRNRYGNLPGGVAARLAREASGTVAKRRVAGRWGVYRGEIEVGGSRLMGFIARPGRDRAPVGKNGRSILVNLGRPRALLVAIQQASYQPVMQEPYDRAVNEALALIPSLMEDELADAIGYMATRARRSQR
ncbi:hypothetical protein [Methylobacterium iners]|uniref:Uncharacterized protein n=1 Tax=Methylobacterium iners TaxID=418707 RepID=A0ABQ4S302_9HYPH|nr:hypothetical protein [Methylobacterium iners]GJD97464.1 hypothetical protein OCOJLMKI_4695 [Methylobacterium iners]